MSDRPISISSKKEIRHKAGKALRLEETPTLLLEAAQNAKKTAMSQVEICQSEVAESINIMTKEFARFDTNHEAITTKLIQRSQKMEEARQRIAIMPSVVDLRFAPVIEEKVTSNEKVSAAHRKTGKRHKQKRETHGDKRSKQEGKKVVVTKVPSKILPSKESSKITISKESKEVTSKEVISKASTTTVSTTVSTVSTASNASNSNVDIVEQKNTKRTSTAVIKRKAKEEHPTPRKKYGYYFTI